MGTPTLKHSKVATGLSFEGLCQTPLLLPLLKSHVNKAYKLPSIGTQSTSSLELYGLD